MRPVRCGGPPLLPPPLVASPGHAAPAWQAARVVVTSIILIPAMVMRHARGVTVRLIGSTPNLERLFSAWTTTERTRFA